MNIFWWKTLENQILDKNIDISHNFHFCIIYIFTQPLHYGQKCDKGQILRGIKSFSSPRLVA